MSSTKATSSNEQNDMENHTRIRKKCTKFVSHHPNKSMKQWFVILQEYVSDDDIPDNYGVGDYIISFQSEIADLLGHEKAIFMPSGTMAQQIALRIWADRVNNFNIALHPKSHLEIAEYYNYDVIHNLQRIQFTIPDFTSDRLLTFNDFKKLKELPGSILLELPQRMIGGQLPEWEDLINIVEWAKKRDIKVHLDGARIWESQPYYNKSLKEIGELFDSVYVSFYKGLGGIAGAMLVGDESFIDEANIWLRRMGGNLPKLFPMYVSAKWGMEQYLPDMKSYFEISKELAKVLNDMTPKVFETNPKVPQTNMFHLFIRGNKEDIEIFHLEIADETGMWLLNGTMSSIIPIYRQTEIVIGKAAVDLDIKEIINNFQKLADKLGTKIS